jgi:predicted ATP-dependent Lon-type protease
MQSKIRSCHPAHENLLTCSELRHILGLTDDLATKINIEFYGDTVDAVFKAVGE